MASREEELQRRLERQLRNKNRPKTETERYQEAVNRGIPSDLLAGRIKGRHVIDKPMEEYSLDVADELAIDSEKAANYGATSGNDYYVSPAFGEAGLNGELLYGPADLGRGDYEMPTSTSNPERPRTLAAGYSKQRQVLTVMFRDGTVYNYYEVDEDEWDLFHSNVSKGEVISTFLDAKPRGPADTSDFPLEIRQQVALLARTQQASQYNLASMKAEKKRQKEFSKAYDRAFKEYRKSGYRAPILNEGLGGHYSND